MKKILVTIICGLLLTMMIGGSCLAATQTQTSTGLNGTTSATSNTIGLFSQCETWGKVGPGSSTRTYMYIYRAKSGEEFSLAQSRDATPGTTWNKYDTPSYSYDSSWYIKLYSSKTSYTTGYIAKK